MRSCYLKKFLSICSGAQVDNEDHCKWVRNKLNVRGPKPFDFVKTVPSFDPSQPFSVSGKFEYSCIPFLC